MFRHQRPAIEQHTHEASDTLHRLGIDHNPADFHHKELTNAIIANDSDGMLDIRVYPNSRLISRVRPTLERRFLWNDRLRKDTGAIDGQPSRFQRGFLSSLDIHSSPNGINRAQEELGRALGQNAFRLERVPRGEKFSVDTWVRGFAEGTVYVADPVASWSVASHDLDLKDHTMGWLHSDGESYQSITEAAQEVVAEYGDQLALPAEIRPQHVDVFANALENLALYVGPILQAVDDAAEAAAALDDELIEKAQESLRDFIDPHAYDNQWSKASFYQDFQVLNIVPESKPSKIPGHIADATVRYIAHIADTLLRVDQTWPRLGLTAEQAEARAVALGTMKKLG